MVILLILIRIFNLIGFAETSLQHDPLLKKEEAMRFCRSAKLDTVHAVLIDMSMPSGKKRLYLIDLQRNKVVASALCCHGMEGQSPEMAPDFSNTPNSNCTSL